MNPPGVGSNDGPDFGSRFGGPDPAISLGEPPVGLPAKDGPVRAVELVIELVGPKSIPARVADALLSREWQGALGAPRVWTMAPADQAWRPLAAGSNGSYDSLALSYPLFEERGTLSGNSAEALLTLAERFANQIERRAMPMPVPSDVDAIVHGLTEIREALDVGYGIAVAFGRPTTEEQLWKALVELGLTLNARGEFVWGTAETLAVSPTDQPDQFTLKGVQANRMMSAVTLGFSVPRSPSPSLSLEATLRVAERLREQFGGMLVDEDGSPVRPNAQQLSAYIAEAQASLERTGIHPGSIEALTLFS